MVRRDADYKNTRLRTGLFISRLLQWASAVVVMGIASYFLAKFDTARHEHIIYDEVIVRLIPVYESLAYS
jgi:hypothetical protein